MALPAVISVRKSETFPYENLDFSYSFVVK